MLERIQARLTYANVTATATLLMALVGSAMVAESLISSSSAVDSVNATWFLGGSENELVSCSRCEVSLTASGSSTFGTPQNSASHQLSPNVTVVASDLSVHVDTAPGNGTRTFSLWYRTNASGAVQCDISGSNTTCNSGNQTLTIPPGSTLLMSAVNVGGAPPTRVQFSWRATPK